MADATNSAEADGPVRPTAAATVAHRPLGGHRVELADGLLRQWQQRNRTTSLPLALRQLETAGNLDNVRLASSGASSGYRGPVFMDSDIYKTLEAISWEVGHAADPDLMTFAAETTALLAKAQQYDGYLNSWIQVTGVSRYTRLEMSHELYCAGHLIQAAIAAARAFDGGALLLIARRFADHLVSTYLAGQAGVDGHPVVETALVELYRQTGHAAYLELARHFVDARGYGKIGDSGLGSRYLQDHQPVREQTALVGHTVRALYLESGVVDVATENGDAHLLASSVRRWDDMVSTKTALTGGNGSRHSGEAFGDAFELPPDRAYNETCAAIASFQWSWRLLLATGESKYADLMERVLYNGFGAAISADGTRFFYVNPLQRRADHFEDDDPGRRREWFSCACCPPNIMRLIASLHHYLATTADDVLYLHLLTPSLICAPLAGSDLRIAVATDYPWDGVAKVQVRSAPEAACGLALRVPAWSRKRSVRLNGDEIEPGHGRSGYLLLRRRWQPGDVLELSVDVRPRLTYPSRRIDALRGTIAVERGPLVYCFEQADQPAGIGVDDLALSAAGAIAERATSIPGVGPTVLLETDAAGLPPADPAGLPYLPDADADAADRPTTAVAVPYFQWDNRDGRSMRVWMPVRPPDNPAPR
jgi:uncharacterized protein